MLPNAPELAFGGRRAVGGPGRCTGCVSSDTTDPHKTLRAIPFCRYFAAAGQHVHAGPGQLDAARGATLAG